MPKYVATGRQPPRTRPDGAAFATSPIAIALEDPPSSSIPSLAPSWPTAKNNNLCRSSTATAVLASGLRLAPGETLPSRSQAAPLPSPDLVPAICTVVGAFDRLRCGVI